MPKPKGWSQSKTNKRDKIAEAVQRKGMGKSSAYAIATTMVKKTGKRKKK